jgi:hypothetical protein
MNSPKMSRKQAKLLWNSLTPQQRSEFNKLIDDLNKNKLVLSKVMVDDNEQVQRIILENKDKPRKPTEPFAKHFHFDD